jgi:hypothetical protein
MDVDCSDITYDTPPSTTVLAAVAKATKHAAAVESKLCPPAKLPRLPGVGQHHTALAALPG